MNEDRLIHALASRYFWPGAEREDVEQEARYALEQARRTYRPGAASFATWAWRVISAHLIEQVRRETLRRPRFVELRDRPHDADVVDLVAARVELQRILAAPLSELERHALGRAIRGESVKFPKTIDNALHCARRKLAA